MKTLKLLIGTLLVTAFIFSCSKDQSGQTLLTSPSNSTGAIIVTGENNGGNVTCEEAALAVGGCTFEKSSGRIDYFGGTGGTTGPITWTTDGTYVHWSSTIGLKLMIIVKGGPNANVYKFCDACTNTSGDLVISAPINPKNGKPYGLSNITFCYSLCEKPKDLVVGLKTFLHNSTSAPWAVSKADGSNINTLGLGVFKYEYTPVEFPLILYGQLANVIGSVKVSDNGTILKVVIDTTEPEWLFDKTHLYVGTYDGYKTNYVTVLSGGMEDTNYGAFPFMQSTPLNATSRVFEIPFSSITQ